MAASGNGHLPTCSSSSLRRWHLHGTGRKKKTGNAPPTVLRGEHEFLLQLTPSYLKAEATRCELSASSRQIRAYSRSAIGKREMAGLTRKRSVDAEQGRSRRLWRRRLLTMPFPFGRLDRYERSSTTPTSSAFGSKGEPELAASRRAAIRAASRASTARRKWTASSP